MTAATRWKEGDKVMVPFGVTHIKGEIVSIRESDQTAVVDRGHERAPQRFNLNELAPRPVKE